MDLKRKKMHPIYEITEKQQRRKNIVLNQLKNTSKTLNFTKIHQFMESNLKNPLPNMKIIK